MIGSVKSRDEILCKFLSRLIFPYSFCFVLFFLFSNNFPSHTLLLPLPRVKRWSNAPPVSISCSFGQCVHRASSSTPRRIACRHGSLNPPAFQILHIRRSLRAMFSCTFVQMCCNRPALKIMFPWNDKGNIFIGRQKEKGKTRKNDNANQQHFQAYLPNNSGTFMFFAILEDIYFPSCTRSTLTSEVLIKSTVQLELCLSNKFWWTRVYSFESLLKSTLSDTCWSLGAANGRL